MNRVLPCLGTAARGADRSHVDVTVVPLVGQIRYLYIETCESASLWGGVNMKTGQVSADTARVNNCHAIVSVSTLSY